MPGSPRPIMQRPPIVPAPFAVTEDAVDQDNLSHDIFGDVVADVSLLEDQAHVLACCASVWPRIMAPR